jgi:hypothetical protein
MDGLLLANQMAALSLGYQHRQHASKPISPSKYCGKTVTFLTPPSAQLMNLVSLFRYDESITKFLALQGGVSAPEDAFFATELELFAPTFPGRLHTSMVAGIRYCVPGMPQSCVHGRGLYLRVSRCSLGCQSPNARLLLIVAWDGQLITQF